jgi:hypothetical protein
MRFFFYGTLLDRDVMALVLGRRLPPAAYAAAVLRGHARRRAKGASYPTLMRDPAAYVPGAVVGGLSARDVARVVGPRGAWLPDRAPAGPDGRRCDDGVGVRAGGKSTQARTGPLEPGVVAAARQTCLRRAAETGIQRAPGVFHIRSVPVGQINASCQDVARRLAACSAAARRRSVDWPSADLRHRFARRAANAVDVYQPSAAISPNVKGSGKRGRRSEFAFFDMNSQSAAGARARPFKRTRRRAKAARRMERRLHHIIDAQTSRPLHQASGPSSGVLRG